MIGKRDRDFADAKMVNRRSLAHRPDRRRRMWAVDSDTAAATHRDGWTLSRFQAERPDIVNAQATQDFKERLSSLSARERADWIDKGLAALKELGL